MYLKTPIGFQFKTPTTTKQIVDSEVVKYLKTWRKQRFYKPSYGTDWQSFDYTNFKDEEALRVGLQQFVSTQLTRGMPQVQVLDVQLADIKRDSNNFSFNLVYRYKKLFESTVYVRMNLDAEVNVRMNQGSF